MEPTGQAAPKDAELPAAPDLGLPEGVVPVGRGARHHTRLAISAHRVDRHDPAKSDKIDGVATCICALCDVHVYET